MGFSRGPKTASNGLVFYIDRDNIKSFKGEPTVNSIVGGSDCADALSAPWLAGAHAGCAVTGQPNVWYSKDRPHVYRFFSTNNTGYAMINQQSSVQNVSGQTYTYSVEFKPIKGDYSGISNNYTIYPDGYKTPAGISGGNALSTTVTEIEDGWYRWVFIYTCTYTGNNVIRFNLFTGGYNGNSTGDFEVLFDNFQFEAKDHRTQFTNGSRTNTDALRDITGLQDALNISNVSFNSNAQMVFDGTNDYLPLPSSYTSASNRPQREITINMMVKFYNFNNQQEIFRADGAIEFDVGEVGGGGSGRMSFWIYDGSWLNTDYNVATNIGTNKWFMATGVYSNLYNRHELYINGQLVVTGGVGSNASLNLAGTGARIGAAGSTTNPFNGEIGVCQIYNRALSSTEILNNFYAIKGRYDL